MSDYPMLSHPAIGNSHLYYHLYWTGIINFDRPVLHSIRHPVPNFWSGSLPNHPAFACCCIFKIDPLKSLRICTTLGMICSHIISYCGGRFRVNYASHPSRPSKYLTVRWFLSNISPASQPGFVEGLRSLRVPTLLPLSGQSSSLPFTFDLATP